MNERFGKEYKLCSKKIIDELFKTGRHIKSFPLRFIYKKKVLTTGQRFQVVISVPKKRFKKAPDRNRLKRLIREAVRKNKHALESFLLQKDEQVALFLIYIGQEILTYAEIEAKIVKAFNRLIEELKSENNISKS